MIDENSVQSYVVSIYFEFEILYKFGKVKIDRYRYICYVHMYKELTDR